MNDKGIGLLIIAFAIIVSIILIMNTDMLMPAGYDLAVDGYVIARTLVILFILHVLVKLGFKLWDKN